MWETETSQHPAQGLPATSHRHFPRAGCRVPGAKGGAVTMHLDSGAWGSRSAGEETALVCVGRGEGGVLRPLVMSLSPLS